MEVNELKKLAEKKADSLERRGTSIWQGIYYGYIFGWQACESQNTPTSSGQCATLAVNSLLIAWEQYKKTNWWESDAIDIEKVLMERFTAIYNGCGCGILATFENLDRLNEV